jgi:hypothetical protein
MAIEVEVKRIDVGFSGGQVLALRTTKEAYDGLVGALDVEGGERWHKLETEDSEVMIDLPQVVYVRRDTEEHKVGF